MAWHVVKGNTIIMHIWYHWHHKQTHYFFTTHPNIFHQTWTLRSHTFYVKCVEGEGCQIGDKMLKRHAQLLLSLVNKYLGAVAQEYFPWKSTASHKITLGVQYSLQGRTSHRSTLTCWSRVKHQGPSIWPPGLRQKLWPPRSSGYSMGDRWWLWGYWALHDWQG